MTYYVICSIEKVGTKSQPHSQDLSPGFRKVAENLVSGKLLPILLPIHKFPTKSTTQSNLLSQPKSQWRGPRNTFLPLIFSRL